MSNMLFLKDSMPELIGEVDEAAPEGETILPEPERSFDFPRVSIADIYENPSPPPCFVWDGRIPRGHVTLLGAHGGAGKSMLALQLAVAVCTGADFLGAATQCGPVVFFSGEDGEPVLRHRLRMIAEHAKADPRELAQSLTILDASDEPTLYRETANFGVRAGEATPGFSRLAEIFKEIQPVLIIIDNASDAFDSNENDRASVRAFMRLLRQLMPETQPAILLLAHIQKSATGAGRQSESYSGSTAWHNSARSRMALTADKEDATRLTLTHEKLNVAARTAQPLNLVRTDGGIIALDNGATASADDGLDFEPPEIAILRLLADFNERGEHVSAEQSAHTNAWKLLRPEADFPKKHYMAAGSLFAAMREFERQGLIQKSVYTNDYRKERTEWLITSAGLAEVAPTAPTAPTYDVDAPDAVSAVGGGALAPTAPTSRTGGVGEFFSQDVGAEIEKVGKL